MKALAERLAAFEAVESDRYLDPAAPIIARIEAHVPTSLKKLIARPHDQAIQLCINAGAAAAAQESRAQFVYTQGMEIVLMWHVDKPQSLWHAGRTLRMASRLASIVTLNFYRMMEQRIPNVLEHAPTFEGRVFQVPDRQTASEVLIWRQWLAIMHVTHRLAAEQFSRQEIGDRSAEQLKQMLFNRGFRWSDVPREFRYGACGQRRKEPQRRWSDEYLATLPDDHPAHANPFEMVNRVEYVDIELPVFSQVTNAVDVFFEGADPLVREPNRLEYPHEALAA